MREGQHGPLVAIDIAAAAPALFVSGDFAIATHADNSVITPEKPAAPGELIVLYAAGIGKAEHHAGNGELTVSLSTILGALRVTVGGEAIDPAHPLCRTDPVFRRPLPSQFHPSGQAPSQPGSAYIHWGCGQPPGVKLPLRSNPEQPSAAAGR